MDVFAAKGYHDAGMQEIAQLAEFGVGTIYRLFPGGKDEIYTAIKERVVDAFERKVHEAFDGVEGERDKVSAYILASANVYGEHPREMAMHVRDVAGLGFDLGKGLTEELAERYYACANEVRQALEQGYAKGLFQDLDPDEALLLLRAVINVFMQRWLQSARERSLRDTAALIEKVFFRSIGAA